MKLAYKAVDKAGTPTANIIEAASKAEANDKLRQQGLFVTEMTENVAEAAFLAADPRSKSASGRNVKGLALWSRQICVLVRSGTPLAQALIAIEKQTEPGPWLDILKDVRDHVEEGLSLTESMSRHPDVFDEVTRSLIAAGESSGQIGPMLDRVATLLRQQLTTRRALTGAMVYPALLTVVGVAVTLVMLLGVLPRFSSLFESLNAALPPTTELLMWISEGLRAYWWGALLLIAATGIGGRTYFRTPGGRRAVDNIAVKLPILGKMVRSLATARIARLLGVMLEARVPLLEALVLTKNSTTNLLYSQLMTLAVDSCTRGEAISSVFSRSTLITPSVSEAIRHGEQNGQIGPILTDMADFLDEENQVIVKTAMGVLEPLILIVLGIIVGFIALSLFIPLFDLTASAGAH